MSLRADSIRILRMIALEGRAYSFGLLCLAAVNAADVLAPVFLAVALDLTEAHLAGTTVATPPLLRFVGLDAAMFTIGGATLAFLALQVIANVFRYPMLMYVAVPSHRIGQRVRNAIIGQMLRLSRPFYDRSRSGDLMSLATNDVSAVRMMLGPGVLVGSDTIIVLVLVVGVLLTLSWQLTLISFLPLPLIALVTNRLSHAEFQRFEAVQEDLGQLTERTRESFAGIRIVQAFAREEFDRSRFVAYSHRHLVKNLELAKVRAIFGPSLDLMLGLATVLVLIFGGIEVVRGTMSLGTFVAFLFLFSYLTGPMVGFGWSVSLFQRGRASLRRIDRFLAEEVEIADAPDAVVAPYGALEVKNLSFTYPTPPPAPDDSAPVASSSVERGPALHDVSFRLEPGKTLGIVGSVGSGKSTLAQLIVRMYEPPPGTIQLGGVDIRDVTQDSLRQRIVVAPQETFLFSDSLERNIAVGGAANRAEVERCVRLAGLGNDINELALGLDTLVGERGVNLSGGQRQRVTIARAVATNPDILVLDDCLSAVDARTEATVLANLREVFAGRSGIVISHRVAAVRDCDEILVLANGRVAERGTHESLRSANGFYGRMVKAQASELEGHR